ncbi:MAG TPA: choice-of-anchor D domain-containing protein [Terriglobales bacterium]|nr:choice-of-anchor D domain-containing protein [Terriglobales bacterium]
MIRKFRILAAVAVAFSFQFSYAVAQTNADNDGRGPQESLQRNARSSQIAPPGIVAIPAELALSFHAAAVGISLTSSQKLSASFDVSGYSGTFKPTAALHYGHDYEIGPVSCVVSGSSETCKVTVAFLPTLPGARKDALLLLDGTTTLATVFLGGIGQAPLSLVQPGIVTSPVANADYYIYQSVVDENGTVYFLSDNSNAVYSLTKAGVVTQLPITGLSSPHAIAIDGAGTLYIAQNTYSEDIVTYTAAGVQGTITVSPPPPYQPCSTVEYLYSVAVDQVGNLFTLDIECNQIFELEPNGTYVTNAIDPGMIQPSEIGLDASDDVYIGGYDINKLTASGVQTQINTVGAGDGVPPDAAETIYATRYPGGGVAELPASDYSSAIANLDPTASPLGDSVASDGTVYVGNYYNLDKVDRSQGAIAFGEQFSGVTSSVEDVGIYNGGNKSLTLADVTLVSGSAFAVKAGSPITCSLGKVIAPGSYCNVAVTMTAPHAGTFSGTITFTTNSLNTTATAQTVALSGFVYGVYAVASPKSLAFGNQTLNTTSATKYVTLTNDGDLYSAFFGTPVSPSPVFNVGLGTCTAYIPVGSSCQLAVTFTPTAAQTYSGTVTVPVSSSGGGTTPSVTFTVSGTGVAAATISSANRMP